MFTRQVLIFAAMLSSPAWAAHGGGGHGGGGGGSRPTPSYHTPYAYSGGHNSIAASAHSHVQRRDRHRGFGYQNYLGNGVVVYPWWLYGDYDDAPATNSYYNDNSTTAPAENGDSSMFNTTPAVDPNAARAAMESVYARARAGLEASPKWVALTAEINAATADSTAATDQMRQTLMNRSDYRAAADMKQAAQDLAISLHEQPAATEDQIMAAANQDLAASQTIARIERNATANNTALIEARTRLQNAAAERQAMKDGLRSEVTSDPTWQAAKQELASAR